MSILTHTHIAEAVLSGLPMDDAPVLDVTTGSHLLAVRGAVGNGIGLASRVDRHGPASEGGGSTRPPEAPIDAPIDAPITMGELARHLPEPKAEPRLGAKEPLLVSAMALAAANALLPTPADAGDRKGQELIQEKGRGRRVVVVGHFPFVERLSGDFASFEVLERNPRPGDLPAEEAERIMPLADVAAITSTTISNGTLAGILNLCRKDCFVLLLGPSTPFASALFDLGVDALAGAAVEASDAVLAGIREGRPFKSLQGVRSLLLMK